MAVLQFYALFSPTQLPQLLKLDGKIQQCSVRLPLPNFILVYSHGTWPDDLKGKCLYCVIKLSEKQKPFCIGSLSEHQRSICWQEYWKDDLLVKSVLMADEGLCGQLQLTLEQPDDLSPVSATNKQDFSNAVCRPPQTISDQLPDVLAQTDTWLPDDKMETYERNLLTEVTPVTTATPKSAPNKTYRRKRNSKEIEDVPSSQKRKTSTKLFNGVKNQKNMNGTKSAVGKTLSTVKNKSDMQAPSCRWGHAFCKTTAGEMLLVGGQGAKQTLSRDSVWVLEKDGLIWTEPPIKVDSHKPQYRVGHTVTYDPRVDCVYVFGGSKNLRWYNDIHVLDMKTWTWSLVKAIGRAPTRAYHSSCLFRDELFVFGGVFPNPDPKPDGCSNQLLIYRLDTQNWYEPIVNGKKPTPRSGHSATVIGDQMVIFGGWDAPLCFNDLIILDLTLMEFSTPATLGTAPSPRSWHASCRLPGNRLLIHGGYNGNEALNDAFIFSLNDLLWTQVELPVPAVPKAGHTLICCYNFADENDKENLSDVIMFGGGDNEDNFFNDTFIFKM
ncbi:acyl-CoA-binding domain-containing protein 4-like [Anneissia japonica]|uniref:acyl-CoA-binding domain-containing protein 4-like n=1 Tax=Anneissia japonica TaxID=1529436 RepID=UPI0014258D2B|nr:acyl-CoA-binding domain-containing protein 4-like [Anneissia japonica]